MEHSGAIPQQDQVREELETAYLQRINSTPPEVLAKQLSDERLKRNEELEKLRSLITFDTLVLSVVNHNHFLELLENEVKATERMPEPSSYLLVLDLDDFKKTNEQLGHPGGDKVLIEIGAALAEVLRDEDTAGRVGGDEFAAIVRRTKSMDDAVAIAQRVRERVADKVHPFDSKGFAQKISFGLCLITRGMTMEKLRDVADAALYTSKFSGKNQMAIGSINPVTNSIETSLVSSQN